jgi:predicted dehydrogenase
LSESDRVSVGTVGSGFIASLHSAVRCDLLRIASRNGATAQALADRFGWQSVTTDWRDVTRGADVDLVVVCTPDASHREIVEDAFAHGKHVFCEKPLAASADEARSM